MSNFEGRNAPAFDLEENDGKKHSLSDYQGKTIVVYLYPKDTQNAESHPREVLEFLHTKRGAR
jgi:peroxiredoxin